MKRSILMIGILLGCSEAYPKKESLLDRVRSGAISFNKICAFENLHQNPCINILNPDKYSCVEIECLPELESLTAVQETSFDLISRTYKKTVFYDVTAQKQKVQCTRRLLLDEYLADMPFLWRLKCPKDLKKLIYYFDKMVSVHLPTYPTKKIPLLISLDFGEEELLNQSAANVCITTKEISFLNEYFDLLGQAEERAMFSLYHKIIFQTDSIKTSVADQKKSLLTTILVEGLEFLKKLGMPEILKTVLLLKLLFFLNQYGPKLDRHNFNYLIRHYFGQKGFSGDGCSDSVDRDDDLSDM